MNIIAIYYLVNMDNIGSKLRQIRQLYKISQLNLEIHCELSIGTISRIEKGKVTPKRETLLKIAAHLSLNREEIIDLMCIDEFLASRKSSENC